MSLNQTKKFPVSIITIIYVVIFVHLLTICNAINVNRHTQICSKILKVHLPNGSSPQLEFLFQLTLPVLALRCQCWGQRSIHLLVAEINITAMSHLI